MNLLEIFLYNMIRKFITDFFLPIVSVTKNLFVSLLIYCDIFPTGKVKFNVMRLPWTS